MFTLAHLSDWHIATQPPLLALASKRGLGYINWHRSRKRIQRRNVGWRNARIRPAVALAEVGGQCAEVRTVDGSAVEKVTLVPIRHTQAEIGGQD